MKRFGQAAKKRTLARHLSKVVRSFRRKSDSIQERYFPHAARIGFAFHQAESGNSLVMVNWRAELPKRSKFRETSQRLFANFAAVLRDLCGQKCLAEPLQQSHLPLLQSQQLLFDWQTAAIAGQLSV